MRIAFVNTLREEARKNKKIVLLTADLGYSVFEEYMREFPTQYLNVGIAEQNMTGVAAGLAMEGYIPIIYSIVPFVTMRNFEQIRNDICYQGLNVKIVGIGAGFSYGPYGHTHHGLEDIAIMRTIPTMSVFGPADPIEVCAVTSYMLHHKGPMYMRLGKAGEPVLHTAPFTFQYGKGYILREGKDVTIFATSTMVSSALPLSDVLAKESISVQVISIPTIKPLDETLVLRSARKTKLSVSIEEHVKNGGFGSAISEVFAEQGVGRKLLRFGSGDNFTKQIGNQQYMREKNGLDVAYMAQKIMEEVKQNEK